MSPGVRPKRRDRPRGAQWSVRQRTVEEPDRRLISTASVHRSLTIARIAESHVFMNPRVSAASESERPCAASAITPKTMDEGSAPSPVCARSHEIGAK